VGALGDVRRATHARPSRRRRESSLSRLVPCFCRLFTLLRSLLLLTLSHSFARSTLARIKAVLPIFYDQVRFPRLIPKAAIRTPRRARNWVQRRQAGGNALPWTAMSNLDGKPGFLSAGINALSPWGSRSTTPKPPPTSQPEDETKPPPTQRGGDHTVNRRRISPRKYPNDCPPTAVRWFHAVDVRRQCTWRCFIC
jgi:hypothetical protein